KLAKRNINQAYFDRLTGTCQWYLTSDCLEGNETSNVFANIEICENVCAAAKKDLQLKVDICSSLPAEITGSIGDHCVTAVDQRRWFYDQKLGICLQFIYTNCAPVQNTFLTQNECQLICQQNGPQNSINRIIARLKELTPLKSHALMLINLFWYFDMSRDAQDCVSDYGPLAVKADRIYHSRKECLTAHYEEARCPDEARERWTPRELDVKEPCISYNRQVLAKDAKAPMQTKYFFDRNLHECIKIDYRGLGVESTLYDDETSCTLSCKHRLDKGMIHNTLQQKCKETFNPTCLTQSFDQDALEVYYKKTEYSCTWGRWDLKRPG
ncbi:hypothetical protein Ciccas_013203, partial [Cichlidogyrus casuarinus]